MWISHIQPGHSSLTRVRPPAANTARNWTPGGVVHVDLQEGGYGGRVNMTISATDRTAFGTDWESPEAAMRLPRSTKLQACRPHTLCTRKVCVISLPPRLAELGLSAAVCR